MPGFPGFLFAWYVATAGNASHKSSTQAVTKATNSYSAGGFDITPIFSVSGNPVLTNDDGETYYYEGAETGAEIPDTGSRVRHGTLTITGIKIEYTGESDNPAEIADLYYALKADSSATGKLGTLLTVTFSDQQTGANKVLKFFEDEPADNEDSSVVDEWAGQATVTLSFANPTSGLTFEKGAEDAHFNEVIEIASDNVAYYGLKGVNDVDQSGVAPVVTATAGTSWGA